ncbi:MAG: twin-arginine translocase TatA/TatE family subunit [Dehalococcoidia bacterium]
MELFGVGIGEAALVLVLALIVLGPERFPQIAREAGRWYRTARRFAAEVTGDLQGALQELESEVNEQSGGGLKSVRELGSELRTGLRNASSDVRAIGEGVGSTVREATPGEPSMAPAAAAGAAAAGAALVTPTTDSTPAPAESEPAVPPKTDTFELVRRSYADYHAPSTPAPAAPPPDPVDPDAMAAHAVEAFAASQSSPAPAESAPSTEPVTPSNGASSALLNGVNPFPSATPAASTSSAPSEAQAPDAAPEVDASESRGEGAPAWPVKRAPGKTSTAPAADRSGG